MQDLKDYTQDVHYENFRKKKLLQASPGYVSMSAECKDKLNISLSLSSASRKVSEYTDYNVGAQGTPEEAGKAAALQEKDKEVRHFALSLS